MAGARRSRATRSKCTYIVCAASSAASRFALCAASATSFPKNDFDPHTPAGGTADAGGGGFIVRRRADLPARPVGDLDTVRLPATPDGAVAAQPGVAGAAH